MDGGGNIAVTAHGSVAGGVVVRPAPAPASRAQRVKALLAEADALVREEVAELKADLAGMVHRLEDDASLPIAPGIQEEFRRLASHITDRLQSIGAINERIP